MIPHMLASIVRAHTAELAEPLRTAALRGGSASSENRSLRAASCARRTSARQPVGLAKPGLLALRPSALRTYEFFFLFTHPSLFS
jgi:hypothetical protein